jgi:beta-lactam-binding protein with PASTA domain
MSRSTLLNEAIEVVRKLSPKDQEVVARQMLICAAALTETPKPKDPLRKVEVPNLTQMSVAEAQETAARPKFFMIHGIPRIPGGSTPDPTLLPISPSKPAGTVTGQSPAAGQYVPAGTTINLTVS